MLRKMRFHEQLIGVGFLLITVLFIGVGFLAWKTTKDVQGTANAIMKENVTSLRATEELELALLNQKGLVSSYFLDRNTDWLSNLDRFQGSEKSEMLTKLETFRADLLKALDRIHTEDFGICADCKNPITLYRLLTRPD